MDIWNVIRFFDRCASGWDENSYHNDSVIEKILDAADIREDVSILDVACGTGIMFDYYKKRNAGKITGIDISPNMVTEAKKKYPGVRVICGDIMEYPIFLKFDRIVLFNAFPHFENPELLVRTCAGLLKENGRFTVAHDASIEEINSRHTGDEVSKISKGLMEAEELAKLMGEYLVVDTAISDSEKYIVSAVKE